MAACRRCRSYGRGKVGSPWICQLQTQIHGWKVGGSSGNGKVGYDCGSSKLGARGDRIEGGGGWLLVRGRRIERAGLRINKKGQIYTPDSEEEDSDTEVEDAAAEGAAAVVAPVAGPGAVEAAEGAPAVVVPAAWPCALAAAKGAPAVETAERAAGMELPSELA